MSSEMVERETRTELADALYRHATDLKALAMSSMLSMQKYSAIREGLEQVCGNLMHLQADMGFLPFDTTE
jgi:hypothetical protein